MTQIGKVPGTLNNRRSQDRSWPRSKCGILGDIVDGQKEFTTGVPALSKNSDLAGCFAGSPGLLVSPLSSGGVLGRVSGGFGRVPRLLASVCLTSAPPFAVFNASQAWMLAPSSWMLAQHPLFKHGCWLNITCCLTAWGLRWCIFFPVLGELHFVLAPEIGVETNTGCCLSGGCLRTGRNSILEPVAWTGGLVWDAAGTRGRRHGTHP